MLTWADSFQLRVYMNGAVGLADILIENIQTSTPSLSDRETRNVNEIASAIRNISSRAVDIFNSSRTRCGEIHYRIGPPMPGPPPPPSPKPQGSWLTDPPRPEQDALLYEHVPNIRIQ